MILLMGIAGSGKGTQGKLLAEKFGFHLISMGDVLRLYATKTQRERMLAGELLADQEIIEIIDKVLKSLPDDREVIVDGFPRTVKQAEWAFEQAQKGRYTLRLAIHLVASREAVKRRLLERARVDDRDDAIEARFDEYERSTMPILEWLSQHDVRVVNVNAERPVDTIQEELQRIISENTS